MPFNERYSIDQSFRCAKEEPEQWQPQTIGSIGFIAC